MKKEKLGGWFIVVIVLCLAHLWLLAMVALGVAYGVEWNS